MDRSSVVPTRRLRDELPGVIGSDVASLSLSVGRGHPISLDSPLPVDTVISLGLHDSSREAAAKVVGSLFRLGVGSSEVVAGRVGVHKWSIEDLFSAQWG